MKHSENNKYNGLLLLDKPLYMSSHQAVGFLRNKLNMRQIGHAGTLDPMATGLLILMVGKATKTSQYLILDNKGYQGTIKLGEISNTYDLEGIITKVSEPSNINILDIKQAAEKLTGKQMQTPPMFSAKKVNGKKLYLAAREGVTIEREAREITVHEFKIIKYENYEITFEIRCSKGTYIRTIANDIGEILKCGAYLSSLRRIESGEFKIESSFTHNELLKLNAENIAEKLIPYEKYLNRKEDLS